jgi:tetratricopeptide (TPR) repeat protein
MMQTVTRISTFRRTLLGVVFLAFLAVIARSEDPGPMYLYQEAMAAYSMRQLKQAREHLDELIKKYPKHPMTVRAKVELARIHLDQREFDTAIRLLTEVSQGDSSDYSVKSAREMLLRQLAELQRFKQGLDLLEEWWRKNPGDEEIGRSLAAFYLQTGKPDEAKLLLEGLLERTASRDVFEDLLKLATKSGAVDSLLSTIEQRRVRYRTLDYLDFVSDCHIALKQERKALDLLAAPEVRQSLPLMKKKARLERSLKLPEQALTTMKAIELMVPADWENIKAMGQCYLDLSQKAEALKVWKKPMHMHIFPPQEGYQLLTETLLEQKLYQEALEAFQEARQVLGNPRLFAEERARVLEAMGKTPEALEEYLHSIAFSGSFKMDIFDKLYKSQNADFLFTKRLKELQATSTDQFAVKRALLEVFFRDADSAAVAEIVALNLTGGMFDEMLYERIQQALTTTSSQFLETLLLALIRQAPETSLAHRLTILLLTMKDLSPEQAQEVVTEAEKLVRLPQSPDISLKIRVLIHLGRFCLDEFHNPGKAREYLQEAVNAPGLAAVPQEAAEALLQLMRLEAYKGNFPAAQERLEAAQKLQTGEPEFPARLLYEEAWFDAQKGNFQEGLEKLRRITTDHPDSMWLNDALSLGLFLTMGSAGSMDPLIRYMEAERAAVVGSGAQALELMQAAVLLASGTSFQKDAQARVFLLSERVSTSTADLLAQTDTWIGKNPAHPFVADLLLMKLRILQRETPPPEPVIIELLKDFSERFPGDLRSRKAAQTLQEIIRTKGKK